MKPFNLILTLCLMAFLGLSSIQASLSPNTSPLTMDRQPGFSECETIEVLSYHPHLCQKKPCPKSAQTGWIFGVFCALVWVKFEYNKKR